MKESKEKKDITPQEASQWLSLLIQLGQFIKSLFKKKKQPNEKPTSN